MGRCILGLLALSLTAFSPACGTASATEDAARVPLRAADALFPAPATGITLSADASSLADLLDRFSDATGWALFVDEGARARLAKAALDASVPRAIAAADVYRSVETSLAEQHFGVCVLSEGTPRILRVLDLEAKPGSLSRNSELREVEPRTLDALAADHPALLVKCLVSLERGDARGIANGMRSQLEPSSSTCILPVANSRHMLVAGPARWVKRARDLAVTAARDASDAASASTKPPAAR